MTDIKVEQDDYGLFDITVVDGDLEKEEGLASAIWISLFSDKRADESQAPDPKMRRGWLGDVANDSLIGSHLWLLDQRRLTTTVKNEAVDYARKALEWMIDDGLATSIEVIGAITPRIGISLTINVTVNEGSIETHFVDLWRKTQ